MQVYVVTLSLQTVQDIVNTLLLTLGVHAPGGYGTWFVSLSVHSA